MNERLSGLSIEALNELKADHYEIFIRTGNEDFKRNFLEVAAEITRREATTIRVTFEQGYRWSVDVAGEGESRATGLTKRDAMAFARQLKKSTPGATIEAQTLTKAERAENISDLHENGYSYRLR